MVTKPNLIDTLYQQAVDDMARKTLNYSENEILDLPDDGTFTVKISGQDVTGWIRHVRLTDGLHHIVFSLTRKTLLVMYKLYLSGIKLDADGFRAVIGLVYGV